jgi:hypothetical protein
MFGWVSQGVGELVAALVAEKAVNAELRAALARERERFDWIAQHMNELKLERAELYRRIGLYVPTPEIARTGPAPDLPGADDHYAVPPGGKVPDLGDLMATARELKERAEKTRLADIARAQEPGPLGGGGFDGFDDIGDAAAAAIGIAHDPATGTVVYGKR